MRRRRKQEARKDQPLDPSVSPGGGWGPDTPVELQDLVFLRRAIREGWDTPQHARDAIVKRLLELLDDPTTRLRLRVSIVRTFALMGEIEQEEEFRARRAARRAG